MPRIFISRIPLEAPDLWLTGEDARYLLSVLRLRPGDRFEVFDEEGVRREAVLKEAARGRARAELGEGLPAVSDPAVPVELVQGILKGGKMDMVVQKAAELGVAAVQPVFTERTVVRETRRWSRWEKIVREAARQSGRASPPVIRAPATYSAWLESLEETVHGYLFWEEGGSVPTPSNLPAGCRIFVVVGPEGGFTQEEAAKGEQAGLVVATLGPRILRAETAAITALGIVQYLTGGLGGRPA
jgi:16S rRNA (uracil1498-N3)-methyltransferase